MGDPVLYDMQVIWVAGDDTTKRDVRFGFRTVQLVQDPIPGSQGYRVLCKYMKKICDKCFFGFRNFT